MKLLNILFNPLNFLNMFTLYLGGGGGGGGTPSATSASNTVSNIAPWAQAGVSQLINSGLSNAFPQYGQQLNAYNQQMQMYNNVGGANNIYGLAAPTAPTDLGNQGGYTPFNTNTATNPTVNQKTIVDAAGVPQANPNYNPAMSQAYQAAQSTTAGFTPLQQQSFTTAANMQVPGQYGTASNMATQAGQGALNTTGQAGQYGKMGAQYGAQGAQQAGQLAGNVANQAQGYGSQAAQAGNIGLQTGQNMANTGQLGLQYGQQGANYGAQGAAAGQSYGQQAQNPGAVQSYMNPYLQSTLAPQMQLLNQQYGMQQNQNDANAIQAGAFGGSGAMLQKSLNQQNQLLAGNQLTSNAYNQAYNVANQNMQNAASLGMQGAGVGLQGSAAGQAGVNTALQGQQGQLAGLSAYQQGLQGAQQGLNTALGAGNLRLSGTAQGIQGAQTGLAGVNAQQAGYGQAGNQATNLANIGSQQQNAAQNIAGLQNAYGAQQQQQQQNIYNTANQNYSTMQAYPMQQLQQLEGMYTGAPTNTTTMNYQAAPSTLSQVAGLGLAGYGLSNKNNAKGGRIRESGIDKLRTPGFEQFAEGGIVGFFEGGGTPADYRQMIIEEAKRKGLDPNTALALSGAEGVSKNPKSSANGYFQMIDKTFKDYGGDPEKRNDPMEQIRVGTDILADNTKKLTKSLGRSPTPPELYTTHFLGEPTGTALLRADPTIPVSEFLKTVSPKKKDQIIRANPEILGESGNQTVGQVRQTLASKINQYLPMSSAQAGTVPQAQAPQQGGLAALIPGQTVKAPAAQPEDTSFMGANWFMNKGAKLGAMMGDEAAGREAGRAAFNTMMAPTPMAPASAIPRSGGVLASLSKTGEQIYNKLVPAKGFTKEGLEALQAETQAAKAAEAANLAPRLTPPTPPIPAGGPAIPVTQAGQGVVAGQDALTQTRLANQAADQAAAAQKAQQLAATAQSIPSAAEAAQTASLAREGSEVANTMAAARAATTAKQLGATTAGLGSLSGAPATVSPSVSGGPGSPSWGMDLGQEGVSETAAPAPVRDLSSPDTGTPKASATSGGGINPDFLIQLGLGMMAGKSPYAMQNIGEAGLGALREQQEAKKYGLEERKIAAEEAKGRGLDALQQQQAKYYGSIADFYERGGKDKNLTFEAEKMVQSELAKNKIATLDPVERAKAERSLRASIYPQFGLTPAGSIGTMGGSTGVDPLGLR